MISSSKSDFPELPGLEEVRFQDSPWYIKLWRYRWYALIPFKAVYFRFCPWVWNSGSDRVHVTEFSTWGEAWSIAVGDAQGRMNWLYTLEEVFGDDFHKDVPTEIQSQR